MVPLSPQALPTGQKHSVNDFLQFSTKTEINSIRINFGSKQKGPAEQVAPSVSSPPKFADFECAFSL